jgi:protease IV
MSDASSPLGLHALPVASRLRRSRSVWRALAFLALIIAALALLVRLSPWEGTTGQHIAEIVIDGTISTSPARAQVLRDLVDDASVAAVIVTINSPGGTTAGGEELYEGLNAIRANKPVVAVIKELGASAAYMTAIGADRIYARRLSIVGSIGVLYQHIDASGLLQRIGIDLDKVASGPLKAEPDFDEPISPNARASLETLIGDSFAWFVEIVEERRGLSGWQMQALADGRILTGSTALESGLIDAIGGQDEAVAWLEGERGIAADLAVVRYFPQADRGFGSFFSLLGGEMRSALGLPENGPIVLDGLVSLWHVEAQ